MVLMVTTVELERQVDDLYDDDDNNDDDDDDRRVGRVRGVASLRGIGNPSRAANPPAKVAQISDEYLTRQKIF